MSSTGSLTDIAIIDTEPIFNESHLKENDHYVNLSENHKMDNFKISLRSNRKDLRKLEQTIKNIDNSHITISKMNGGMLERKLLNQNNENCLTAEIKNRYRQFNHYSNRRTNLS